MSMGKWFQFLILLSLSYSQLYANNTATKKSLLKAKCEQNYIDINKSLLKLKKNKHSTYLANQMIEIYRDNYNDYIDACIQCYMGTCPKMTENGFFLLSPFFLSTTLKNSPDIPIKLPSTSDKNNTALNITISASGRYTLRRTHKVNSKEKTSTKEVNTSDLKQMIKEITMGDKKIKIFIRADPTPSYQKFVKLMDTLNQLGFKSISIIK